MAARNVSRGQTRDIAKGGAKPEGAMAPVTGWVSLRPTVIEFPRVQTAK